MCAPEPSVWPEALVFLSCVWSPTNRLPTAKRTQDEERKTSRASGKRLAEVLFFSFSHFPIILWRAFGAPRANRKVNLKKKSKGHGRRPRPETFFFAQLSFPFAAGSQKKRERQEKVYGLDNFLLVEIVSDVERSGQSFVFFLSLTFPVRSGAGSRQTGRKKNHKDGRREAQTAHHFPKAYAERCFFHSEIK